MSELGGQVVSGEGNLPQELLIDHIMSMVDGRFKQFTRPFVENHTEDDTLKYGETGSIHTNYGDAGTQTLTLPAGAPKGTNFKFIVGAAQEMRIAVGAAGDVIILDGTVNTDDGGGDGYIAANDEGESAELWCIASGIWLVGFNTTGGVWAWTQP